MIYYDLFKNIQLNISDSTFLKQISYDPSSVPKGGFNKGIILLLKCSCPSSCICNSNKERVWYHQCGEPLFLTEQGDILCKNHLKNCAGQFIKDAFFQCNKAKQSNTRYQHQQMSNFLMVLSKVISNAENNLDTFELDFTQNIVQSLQKRWYT
ncbi:unnamed protein product [Paramecium pentaurelia]|uniref:Uncharacterized protein n=1 Tax=Paramecium pentaurelia TaxID=43138 RepID=A0A8S1XTB3_9CILI|nr:unnamed protein product [Paramecium pentaurelia]